MSRQVLEPAETPLQTSDNDGVEATQTSSTRELVAPSAPPRESATRPVRIWWRPRPTDIPALTVMVGFVAVGLVILSLVIALVGINGPVSRSSSSSMDGMNMGQTSAQTSGQTTAANVPQHNTYNAQPPAAPAGDVANIKLVAKEALISIAPGVAYHAWTFNGTVPGPILRVRQGQLVNFTLVNDGSMPHSIDFHAAQTPWSVNYQSVAPGKSFTFSWRANYPGVFMYHCGTSPAMYHIANGMYGAIIVDPATGWAPAQEYVLVQSEFYTHQNADGTYSLDGNKMMAVQPDIVAFNGYANQYKTAPLQAKAGQRIRLFIVDAGPSEFAAFHVIGAIFSDVYVDGNPANHTVGDQTVTVPPGGGTVVELTIPDAGSYPFVTHSFADADLGALGMIAVSQ
jgi:nitrite reductase (NO-forming)